MSRQKAGAFLLLLLLHYVLLLLVLVWIPSWLRVALIIFAVSLVVFELVIYRLLRGSPDATGDGVIKDLIFATCAAIAAIGIALFDFGLRTYGIGIIAVSLISFTLFANVGK